jgi:hypothetical protein
VLNRGALWVFIPWSEGKNQRELEDIEDETARQFTRGKGGVRAVETGLRK